MNKLTLQEKLAIRGMIQQRQIPEEGWVLLERLFEENNANIRRATDPSLETGGSSCSSAAEVQISNMSYENFRATIFVLGHGGVPKVADLPYLEPVNLDDLNLDNRLAESRIFLSNLPDQVTTDYIGFATYRWNEKFPKLRPILPLEKLWKLPLAKNVVWAPVLAEGWVALSESYHPGMTKYLEEAASYSNMSLTQGHGMWCNNFICHKSVYKEFQQFFRHMFDFFFEKYGYSMDFGDIDEKRRVAYFYERMAILFFSNRTDLEIRAIPARIKK